MISSLAINEMLEENNNTPINGNVHMCVHIDDDYFDSFTCKVFAKFEIANSDADNEREIEQSNNNSENSECKQLAVNVYGSNIRELAPHNSKQVTL